MGVLRGVDRVLRGVDGCVERGLIGVLRED